MANKKRAPQSDGTATAQAHNAAELAESLKIVADLIDYAVQFVPAAGAMGKAVDVAKKVTPQLRDLVKRVDDFAPFIDAALEQAPGAARAMGEAAAKAGEAAGDAAEIAARAVVDPVKAELAARQVEKERKEALKLILEGASASMPLAKFEEQRSTHLALVAGGAAAGVFPGCYVILRVGKGVGRDIADYKDVYVGAAENMWTAVADELAGLGNPDVYADAKYNAGMHILLYPYPVEQLERARQGLIVMLGADASYNARELHRLA